MKPSIFARLKLSCALLICAGILAGCGSSSGSDNRPPPDDSSPPDNGGEFGLDERPSNPSCIAPDAPGNAPTSVALVEPFAALPDLDSPLAMLELPGDNSHFYVAERDGRVRRFANASSVDQSTLLLDISAQVEVWSEGGLLSMAFHPNVAANRKIYLSYTTASDGPDRSVISRFTLAPDFASIDPSSERVVLELEQPAGNHNGGHLAFGPDGYLYIGFGDGGADSDESQNRANFYGSLLRIDVDPNTETAPFYRVPDDNPFVGDPNSAAEIFAFGLRNPWRWSFDTQTGQLWLADVGAVDYEEINRIDAGDNYGWPIMEGMHCRESGCDTQGLTSPLAEYRRSNGGCAITGGYVYRGSQLPGLDGSYIYGDYCNGEVWALSAESDGYESTLLANSFGNLPAFAQDSQGEIYTLPLSSSGRIHRLENNAEPGSSNIPQTLSESDCFTASDPRQPASALIPFDVISPLWSDGAEKERFLAVPDEETVDLNTQGDFDFPVGTVLAKHFSHNNTMIETRLFMHHQSGWAGYSYEWNDAQNDATLLDGAKDRNVAGLDWHFPSRAECMQCHTQIRNFALAPEVRQLNHTFSYRSTGRSRNQMDTLEGIGLFSSPPDPALEDATLFALNDESASLEQRVKSYLDANCAQCHQPGGSGNSGMDLRFETNLAEMNICDVSPAENLGISGARLLAPASPSQSVMLQRMQSEEGDRMPPLASKVVHADAVRVFSEWINSISSCP